MLEVISQVAERLQVSLVGLGGVEADHTRRVQLARGGHGREGGRGAREQLGQSGKGERKEKRELLRWIVIRRIVNPKRIFSNRNWKR